MNSSSNNKFKETVQKIKSIPCNVYFLAIINLILLVSFVFQDYTVLYLTGLLIFVIGVVTALGNVTGFFKIPTDLIS